MSIETETNDERILRLMVESAAHQKRQEDAGVPGAHLRHALAMAFLSTMAEGYLISDFECFRLSPLYTGNKMHEDSLAKRRRAIRDKQLDPDELVTRQLITDELNNITLPAEVELSPRQQSQDKKLEKRLK